MNSSLLRFLFLRTRKRSKFKWMFGVRSRAPATIEARDDGHRCRRIRAVQSVGEGPARACASRTPSPTNVRDCDVATDRQPSWAPSEERSLPEKIEQNDPGSE